jgi:LacI family transcriptional regulator
LGVVTIKDVARLAGVSHTTVSHIINGTRYVSPETRARVLKAIKDLDYHPHSSARSLHGKKTGVVGLVIPDIANPFYVPIVRSIEEVMNGRNYNVILCNTEENPERERTYIQLLRQREVDGLIIAPTGANHDLLLKLYAGGKPVVLIDRYFPAAGSEQFLPTVITDNLTGSRHATCHLLEQGHRRIALLLNDLPISTSKERYDGYVQAFQEAGVPLDLALIKYCVAHVADARRLVCDLLEQPGRPTAIFATNSPLTIGTLLALRDLRLKCPEDVSVIGFDDLTEISPTGPVITTVSQPAREIGQRAAELFLLYLDGNPPPAEIYRLDTHFVVGETTARPRPN